MGNGSRAEADRLGMIWVGDGAKQNSGEAGLVQTALEVIGHRPLKTLLLLRLGHKLILKPIDCQQILVSRLSQRKLVTDT